MGIAALSDWIQEHLGGHQPTQQPQQPPHQQPQTIQPGVPLPTFTPLGGHDYSVQGLAPGASTFADYYGLGVLRNPPQGVVYFDPTGRANNNAPHGPTSDYLAVPMAQSQFQPMPYLRTIGGQ